MVEGSRGHVVPRVVSYPRTQNADNRQPTTGNQNHGRDNRARQAQPRQTLLTTDYRLLTTDN
jgi:hypothetical protein